MRMALLPFKYPIVIAMLYFGGTLNSMWMWSGIALPSTSSTSFCRHNSRSIFPISRRALPKNSFFRYFGKITTWYLQSHFTWAWLCQSFITVLLSPFGAFLKEDRLSRTTQERQSLMNSHRQSRWISYDLLGRRAPLLGSVVIDGPHQCPLALTPLGTHQRRERPLALSSVL
jgi:hypothetical protein